MKNEPKKNEVDCSKNCDSIIKECIVNGEDVLICGNTFNRCLFENGKLADITTGKHGY